MLENHQETSSVEDKLGFIQRVLQTGDYDVAVKESCTLFEVVFRKIFQQAVVTLPYKDRETILEIERKIGKGNKGVQDFGFGELVGLFRESRLMEKWAKHTSREFGIIQTLDYSEIVNLRNKITHKGATCSRGEANLVFEYLRNLLAVLGFADLDKSIHKSFQIDSTHNENKEPNAASKESESLLQKLPQIRKTGGGKSHYAPTDNNEKARLKVQGLNYRGLDMTAFRHALDLMSGDNGLIALDLGCSDGYVTVDRFSQQSDKFIKIIGVDRNKDKIEEATLSDYGDHYYFHTADVESADFEDAMNDILQRHGKTHFDFIFSALTIHHLANPLKALFKLRKLLRNGGCILLRGSDDGSKIAYPDDQNLVKNIMILSSEVEGASDRENGRKLFHQLKKSGFLQVDMLYEVIDTANKSIDDRMSLFQGSFSYRINNFKKRLEREPENRQFQDEYIWMKEALEELEMEFINDSFYYHEMIYAAVGRK